VRNAWPDGSAKFLQVAGSYSSTGGVASTITLASGTASTGTALTTSDLQAALTQPVTVDAGGFGSASWSGADWASPFLVWTTGHLMSSWIYRKQVGADAHLVAWLEVRLYAGGAVDVLPWIENGYLKVLGPTNKSATYTLTMGGTARVGSGLAIDLKHHQRTPLLSGAALSHWLGTDPDVAVVHDTAYLQSTELVPTYSVRMAAGATEVAALPAAYTPLAAHSFIYDDDLMESPGYGPAIGLIPQHDAIHLVADESNRAATYAAVVRNGFAAGRYGIHFRDEAAGANQYRPPSFADYPTLVLRTGISLKDTGASTTSTVTPAVTGGNPPQWDTAHCPSVGFMAYLLTGRFYFMEECQFAAISNHFNVTDWARSGARTGGVNAPGYTGASGVMTTFVQTRSAAWWFRSCAQALCITPDSDTTLRTQFANSVQNTIDHFHAKHIAASSNTFGVIQPGEAYEIGEGSLYFAMWQQDFVTASWGYGLAMGLPISSPANTKLQALFAWKAQSVVGRLGGNNASDWWYVNGATYSSALCNTETPNWTTYNASEWYSSWRAAYNVTVAYHAGATISTVEGRLNGPFWPESVEPSTWNNMMPALAYAVRFGVAGARAAYWRVVESDRFAVLLSWMRDRPVWATMPATGDLPTWAASVAKDTWYEIPNTTHMGSAAAVGDTGGDTSNSHRRLAFCGLSAYQGEVLLMATGGHGDYSGNEVTGINMLADSPAWALRRAKFTGSTPVDVAYYQTTPTLEPSSCHTYDTVHNSTIVGKLIRHSSPSTSGNGIGRDNSTGFDLTTNVFNQQTATGVQMSCRDSDDFCYGKSGFFKISKWNPATDTYADTTGGGFAAEVTRPLCADPVRGSIFQLSWGDGFAGGTGTRAYRYNGTATTQTAITLTSADGSVTQFAADGEVTTSMQFDPWTDEFLYLNGVARRLYGIKPTTGTSWAMRTVSSGVGPPASESSHTRMVYIPALRGVVSMPRGYGNLYYRRTR
jgi:hypothetical protein